MVCCYRGVPDWFQSFFPKPRLVIQDWFRVWTQNLNWDLPHHPLLHFPFPLSRIITYHHITIIYHSKSDCTLFLIVLWRNEYRTRSHHHITSSVQCAPRSPVTFFSKFQVCFWVLAHPSLRALSCQFSKFPLKTWCEHWERLVLFTIAAEWQPGCKKKLLLLFFLFVSLFLCFDCGPKIEFLCCSFNKPKCVVFMFFLFFSFPPPLWSPSLPLCKSENEKREGCECVQVWHWSELLRATRSPNWIETFLFLTSWILQS